MAYLLRKNTVSVVRRAMDDAQEALKKGYEMVGICDNDGNLDLTGAVVSELPASKLEAVQAPVEKKTRGRK